MPQYVKITYNVINYFDETLIPIKICTPSSEYVKITEQFVQFLMTSCIGCPKMTVSMIAGVFLGHPA